jgi:hypothetical protein
MVTPVIIVTPLVPVLSTSGRVVLASLVVVTIRLVETSLAVVSIRLAVVTIRLVVTSVGVVEAKEIIHNKPLYNAFKGFVLAHECIK